MKFTLSHLVFVASLVIITVSATLFSCSTGESKSGSDDSTSAASGEDLPFDTLVSFCNWTEVGMRDKPSEKGKYITTVYLGEHFTLSGDTATEVNGGKKILYRKATLGDGREGWLRDEFLAIDAVPGVVIAPVSVFKRPEETTITDKEFAVLDVVAVKPSKSDWIEVNGKPADKTWYQNGYLKMPNVSLLKRDVDLAVIYKRAMATKDVAAQQTLMKHIQESAYYQGSSLYEVIFPPEIIEEGYGDAYEEGDGEEESGDTERNYVMYNFSGGVNDLDNNGATFIPDSDGVANSALFFNGTAFLSRELNATEDGSYCFWIQAKKVQPAAIPFIVGNGCTSGYAINLEDDKNGGMLVTVLCGGVNTNITDSDYSLPINQWVHLCLVKTANDFSIYVNGELSTSGTSAFNPPFEGLTIGGAWGCNPTEQKGSFYGNIDDVFIANYALDDAGVKEVKSGKFK